VLLSSAGDEGCGGGPADTPTSSNNSSSSSRKAPQQVHVMAWQHERILDERLWEFYCVCLCTSSCILNWLPYESAFTAKALILQKHSIAEARVLQNYQFPNSTSTAIAIVLQLGVQGKVWGGQVTMDTLLNTRPQRAAFLLRICRIENAE
jgi:hypothetical protein